MNRLNNKRYYLYGNTTNAYGEQVKSDTPLTEIYCNIVERRTEVAQDKATSVYADFFGVTTYKEAKPGMTIADDHNSFLIVSVINSTRLSQLVLKKQ